MTTGRGHAGTIDSLKRLCGALLLTPLGIGVALYFAMDGLGDYPATPLALALSAAVLVSLGLAETIGFRASQPESAAVDDEARAGEEVLQYHNATVLRFAITEAPIIIAIAVCFTRDDGMWPYVMTGVPAVVITAYEIWPSRRNIEKYARAVEATGQPSYLRQRLLDGG